MIFSKKTTLKNRQIKKNSNKNVTKIMKFDVNFGVEMKIGKFNLFKNKIINKIYN